MLRNGGMIANVVEHWNAFARRRIDLFGCIDIVALDIARGRTIGVQTTAGSSVAARVDKILGECAEDARAWLLCGNRLVVHGWAKRGKRGAVKRWTCREVEIVLNGEAMVELEERAT
jgi:hypothetical protein